MNHLQNWKSIVSETAKLGIPIDFIHHVDHIQLAHTHMRTHTHAHTWQSTVQSLNPQAISIAQTRVIENILVVCVLSVSEQQFCYTFTLSRFLRLRNDLYCVEWGVKLYSLTHSLSRLHSSASPSVTSNRIKSNLISILRWHVESESRRMMAETSQSVQCMRCRTVRWSLACFVRRAGELSQASVKWHRVPDWRRANAEGFHWKRQRHVKFWLLTVRVYRTIIRVRGGV